MHTGGIPEPVERHILSFFPTSIISFKQVNRRYSKLIAKWIYNQERFCEIYKIKIEQLQNLFQVNYHKMPMCMLAVCIEDYMVKVSIIQRVRTALQLTKEVEHKQLEVQSLCCRKFIVLKSYKGIVSTKTEELYCHDCRYNTSDFRALFYNGFYLLLNSIPNWERVAPTVHLRTLQLPDKCFPKKYVTIAQTVSKAAFCAKAIRESSAGAGSGADKGAGPPSKRQKIQ